MEMNGGFLVTKIKQLGDRIFEKILSEKNIDAFNGAQGRILYVLWQEDGISIRSLSVKCGLAITSLTTMLERMENQGLISRVQSETDKRKTLLFLTEKAHALKGEYDSVSVALICAPRFGIAFVWLAIPVGWLANFLISYVALRRSWPTDKMAYIS